MYQNVLSFFTIIRGQNQGQLENGLSRDKNMSSKSVFDDDDENFQLVPEIYDDTYLLQIQSLYNWSIRFLVSSGDRDTIFFSSKLIERHWCVDP